MSKRIVLFLLSCAIYYFLFKITSYIFNVWVPLNNYANVIALFVVTIVNIPLAVILSTYIEKIIENNK